jgi:hypothetical protein
MHLVRPEGHDDQTPPEETAGEQEAEQVAGAGVGPVGVLDHQDDGSLRCQRLDQRVDRLEDVRPVQPLRELLDRDLTAQARQRRMRGQLLVGLPGHDIRELSEHLRERQVGHRGLAEVEAVPDQGAPPLVPEALQRLRQKTGLAHSSITGEQHHPSPLRTCGGAEQLLELTPAADDRLGPAPLPAHTGHHRPPRRSASRAHAPAPPTAVRAGVVVPTDPVHPGGAVPHLLDHVVLVECGVHVSHLLGLDR